MRLARALLPLGVALLCVSAGAQPAAAPAAFDRRPIGVVTLAGAEYRSRQNPRGWFPDFHGTGAAALDARDPTYARRFAQRLTDHADRCAKWARAQDCQAVLVWDVEGQEFQPTVGYVGDPRVLPPEMTIELAQAFSKKFSEAGIRVGGTIRPQMLLQTPYGPRQARTGDPSIGITEKVNYARRVFGWRIFYVESNTTADSYADGKPHPLPAEVFRKLSAAFPDCLFVTEFAADDGSYAKLPAVLPWRPFVAGDAAVPAGRGALAIRPADEALQGPDREKVVAAFRSGCVPVLPVDRPLVETWGPKVKDMYREAAIEPVKAANYSN
jgi:hypothetical protein